MDFSKFLKDNEEDITLEEDMDITEDVDIDDEEDDDSDDDGITMGEQLSLIPEENGKSNFKKHTETSKADSKKANDKNKKPEKKVTVKSTKETVKAKTKEEEIEEKLSEYTKIIVKVFGRKEYEFTDTTDIKLLKLNALTNLLITEKDYEEFSNGITWSLTPGTDKTTGYLIPTYKFHPKG